ncbi:MAG: hypothetical protein ACKVOP_13175 [Sphingomonadaceae bacterium]
MGQFTYFEAPDTIDENFEKGDVLDANQAQTLALLKIAEVLEARLARIEESLSEISYALNTGELKVHRTQ